MSMECEMSDAGMDHVFPKIKEKTEPLPVRPESSGWVSVDVAMPKEIGIYRVKGMRGSASPKKFETDMRLRKIGDGLFFCEGDRTRISHWKPKR